MLFGAPAPPVPVDRAFPPAPPIADSVTFTVPLVLGMTETKRASPPPPPLPDWLSPPAPPVEVEVMLTVPLPIPPLELARESPQITSVGLESPP